MHPERGIVDLIMTFLLLASALWALAYGFNKQNLAGINPFFIAAAYCFVAFIMFLPFLIRRQIGRKFYIKLLIIGAIEFGAMSSFFQCAFFYLSANEIALWMLTTPIFVVIIDDFLKKQLNVFPIITSICAIGLSFLLLDFVCIERFSFQGILLLQACNLSFAIGQIMFRQFCEKNALNDVSAMSAILYLGGFAICAVCAILAYNLYEYRSVSVSEIYSILIIGVVCCGLCNFLWNKGAIIVNIPVLAVMHNAQIPLAIIFSCIFFGETVSLLKLFISLSMIAFFSATYWFSKKKRIGA